MAGVRSPYAGKTVPLDGILYPRYSTVEELLNPSSSKKRKATAEPAQETAPVAVPAQAGHVTQAAPAAAPPTTTTTAAAAAPVQKNGKNPVILDNSPEAIAARKALKRQKREDRRKDKQPAQPSPAPEGGDADMQEQPTQRQPSPSPAPAGGNAAEAQRIRAALGYTPPTPAAAAPQAAPAPAATAPAAKPGGGSFGFGFSVQEQIQAETEAKIAHIMAMDACKDGFVPRRVWVCGMPHEYSEQDIRSYWGECGEIESLELLTFKDSGRFNGALFITFTTEAGYNAALAVDGEQLEGRKVRVEKCRASALRRKVGPGSGPVRSSAPAPVPVPAAGGQTNTRQQPEQRQEAKHEEQAANKSGSKESKGSKASAAADTTQAAPTQQQPASAAGGGGGGDEHVAYVGNLDFDVTERDLAKLFKDHSPTQIRLHTDKVSGRSKGFAHVHFADDATLKKALELNGQEINGRNMRVLPSQPKKNKQ